MILIEKPRLPAELIRTGGRGYFARGRRLFVQYAAQPFLGGVVHQRGQARALGGVILGLHGAVFVQEGNRVAAGIGNFNFDEMVRRVQLALNGPQQLRHALTFFGGEEHHVLAVGAHFRPQVALVVDVQRGFVARAQIGEHLLHHLLPG